MMTSSQENIMRLEVKEDTTPLSLKGRDYYKPFQYPWAAELAMKHEKIHWLPTEVSLSEDLMDWATKLSDEERHLLTQLFRFFTQADVDVMGAYAGEFLPTFRKHPELAGMFASIAAREWVHTWGYSLLLETVGMPETEYQAFQEYEEMAEKHDFVHSFDCSTPEGVAKTLAVYGAFTEGLQLFSTFAILMNFPRFGKMKGMGKIVEWSIRDEACHIEACIGMYHAWLEENPQIDRPLLEKELVDICKKMVDLEYKFIDLSFGEVSNIEGLSKDEMKQYIQNMADVRLKQLGLDPIYGVENPLDWLDVLIYGEAKTSFFENKETKYSKGAIQQTKEVEW